VEIHVQGDGRKFPLFRKMPAQIISGGGNNLGGLLAVNEENSHDFVGASFTVIDAKLMGRNGPRPWGNRKMSQI